MVAVALAATAFAGTAGAQDDEAPELWGRYEFWMGPVAWPAVADLAPLAGSFDSAGLALGLGLHFPVRRYDHSDLLVGFDLSVTGVDSDVDGFLSTVMARHLFFGVSAKWLFGEWRNVSLDAGVGYHEADIAEVSTMVWGLENELWTASRAGAWVGATWDVGRNRPERHGGLFVAAKAHFVDFGNVRDDNAAAGNILGQSAGRLDSPIYVLEIGYSGR